MTTSGITLIGLGPGGQQHWTQAATTLLQEATEIATAVVIADLDHLSAQIQLVAVDWGAGPEIYFTQTEAVAQLMQLAQRPRPLRRLGRKRATTIAISPIHL